MDHKFILYIRKSSESEDRQMASIEDQKSVMLKYARDRGLRITEIISESKSAKTPGRPGFEKMIEKFHNGEADGILCWKLNRLARNPIDGGKIIHLLQEGVINQVQTFSQCYHSQDNHLVMYLEFGVANQFVRDLSNDIRRGQAAKAKRGWIPSGGLALGYQHVKESSHEIRPDKKFPMVQKIWDLALSGQNSLDHITQQAAAINLKNKNGRPLSKSSIHYILTNEFYAGYYTWKDQQGIEQRYRGKHKAMVTLREFDRVQILLGKKGKPRQTGNKYDFRFRGPFKCGECHSHITAEHKLQVICTRCKKKFAAKVRKSCPQCGLEVSSMKNPTIIDKVYYHCTNKQKVCSQRSIEEQSLTTQVNEFFDSISIPKPFLELLQEIVGSRASREDDGLSEQLVPRHKELTSRLNRLYDLKLDGDIDDTSFQTKKTRLQQELAQIEEAIDSQKEKGEIFSAGLSTDLIQALRIPQIQENGDNDQTRALLKQICSNLELKDKRAIFHTKKPYLIFQELYKNHQSSNGEFEPRKSVENKGSKGRNGGVCPAMWSRLDELRTYYIQQYYGIKED